MLVVIVKHQLSEGVQYMSDNNMRWSVASVWNEALENGSQRELKERNYIWASEIGGAFIDRYLKMKAVLPTNPPNARSLRKFEAGDMMEWVVGMVLKRAGIYKDAQEWVRFQYPGLLYTTGRLDFLAGGAIDWEKAKSEVFALELPEFFGRAATKILEYLSINYPNGLENIIIEVKSCSSFMFDRYEKTGADPHHKLQAFHYLKGKNMPEAHIVYISRDDLRMLEFGVFNPSNVEEEYKADIKKMTDIFNGQEPEKEPLVIYDPKVGRFSRNWKVAYSNYLTRLYGYESQMDYENEWTGKINSWNRVFNRCVKGDKMTGLNLEIIEKAKKIFPDWDKMVDEVKAKGIKVEDENEGGEEKDA